MKQGGKDGKLSKCSREVYMEVEVAGEGGDWMGRTTDNTRKTGSLHRLRRCREE
jgi:hypothetical protein